MIYIYLQKEGKKKKSSKLVEYEISGARERILELLFLGGQQHKKRDGFILSLFLTFHLTKTVINKLVYTFLIYLINNTRENYGNV